MADAASYRLSWLLAAGGLWLLAAPCAWGTNAPAFEEGAVSESAPVDNAGQGARARLRVPPIGIWGSLAYDFRRQGTDDHDASLQHVFTAKIDASSYLYQPWFATVSGGVGLSMGWFSGGEVEAPGRDQFVTAHGRLNLFPRSRFPFEAHFNVSDTRADGTGGGALPASRGISLGMSQSYRPENGPYVLSGSFEHASQDNGALGTDTQDTLTFSADTRWRSQTAVLNGTVEHNTRGRTGETLDFESIVARHSYLPSSVLSVESIANATRNDVRAVDHHDDTTVVQLSSVAYWRPLQRPYTATASARVLTSEGSNGASIRTANLNAGVTYNFNPRFRVNGAVGVGALDTTRGVQVLHSEAVGAAYQGESIDIGPYRYDWNASASASYSGTSKADQNQGDQGNVASASGGVGHSLSRSFVLRDGSALGLTVGQSVDVGTTTAPDDVFGSGTDARLGTSASLTWSKGSGGVSGYARLSATDSRDVVRHDALDMVNAQISGTWQLTRSGTLTGDLTGQWIRNRIAVSGSGTAQDLTQTRTSTLGLSANIAYRQQRLFNVPRLRFSSELRITDDSVLQQDAARLLPDRESKSWENRLDYRIGRLATSLSFRIYELNHKRNTLAMFRIQRDFSGVASW